MCRGRVGSDGTGAWRRYGCGCLYVASRAAADQGIGCVRRCLLETKGQPLEIEIVQARSARRFCVSVPMGNRCDVCVAVSVPSVGGVPCSFSTTYLFWSLDAAAEVMKVWTRALSRRTLKAEAGVT